MSGKILIVSHYFDPTPQIGARRWSKFAKYLVRAGKEVHVLTTPSSPTERTPSKLGVQQTFIARNYPAVLDTAPRSIFNKIRYRLALRKVKNSIAGAYYDRTALMENEIVQTASKLIEKEGVSTLICTGAPFSLLNFGAQIKKKFPQITYIADIRDPWTWGKIHGMDQLEGRRLEIEKAAEAFTVATADFITVPVPEMKGVLSELYPSHARKIIELAHAYDADEIAERTTPITGSKKWVYFGTINKWVEKQMHALCQIMVADTEITWHQYTRSPMYGDIIAQYGLEDRIVFKSPVPSHELFPLMANYDLFVCPWPEYGKHQLSTKFIELFACRMPIVYLGFEGHISEFISENKLGVFIPEETAFADLQSVLENGQFLEEYNSTFDPTNRSFQRITDQLISLIDDQL